MPRYQFLVGVSLTALEEELNRMVSGEPSLKLHQVLYIQGTGFVAVVEHSESAKKGLRTEQREQPEEPNKNPRGAKRKI